MIFKFFFLLLPLTLTISVGAAIMPLSEQPKRFDHRQEKVVEFKPDFLSKKYYLQLDARLDNGTKSRNGSWFALRLELNGRTLNYEQLVNYRGLDYTAYSGMKYPIYSRAHRIFRVVYSPDFQEFPQDTLHYMPVQLGRYPYRLILDVTDLVKPGELNRLKIANLMTIGAYPMIVDNVKLTSEFTPADWSKELPAPDLSPLPGVTSPRTNWTTPFRHHIDANGDVMVDDFRIVTRYSIPEGKWLDTARTANPYYRIERKVEAFENYVRLSDTITNTSKEPVGLMIRYAVDGKSPKIESLRLNGFRQIGCSGFRQEQILNAENPSLYVAAASGGVGLLAVDDALRANLVTGGSADEEYYMMNRRLVIDPGKSYTTAVDVYPTKSNDYFEFVNAARRNWKVNFKLENLVFAHGFSQYTKQRKQQDFVNFVKWHKPYYVGFDTQTYITPEGHQVEERNLEDYVWGSPQILTERFAPLRAVTVLLRDRFSQVDPNLHFLAYHNSYQIPSKDTAIKYPNELWRDREGKPVTYSRVKSQRILPTVNNKTGKALFETFDRFYIPNRLGLFWDESIGVDPLYSYHTPWDGYSGELDPKSFRLQQKVTNIILYTQDYQRAVLNHFARAGLSVVCNFEPGTWTVAKQANVLRFVEGHDPMSGNRTHFYSPVAWGAADSELTENDIAGTMRTHLSQGALFMYYSRKFEHDNNFIQEFYPITPQELHTGYVIGAEKIITMRSGTFSWRDTAPLRAVIFDRNGFRCREAKNFQVVDGHTQISIALKNDEVAVIHRGY